MPKNSNPNLRRTALRDLRVLITTLSLTAIIGLWNLFSRQAQPDQTTTSSGSLVNAGPAPTGEDGLPPLPTLVIIDDAQDIGSDIQTTVPTAAGAVPLREVTAPTPVIIQNRPPVVESVVIGQQPAADDEPGPKPAARTGSSK